MAADNEATAARAALTAPAPPTNPLGVFTTDAALIVRTWDRWLAEVTGLAADAVRGRPLVKLVPDLAARRLLAPFQQVLTTGVVEVLAPALHRYLIKCPPTAASRFFEVMQQRVTIGPLRQDGRVIGTMVTIEDVTERLEYERDLAARLSSGHADERLQAAEALAAADELAGPEPLTGALGDDDWRVRRAARQGLARRTTPEVVREVLAALREDHRNFSVLSSAVELLARCDFDVVPPVVELLGAGEADVRLQAALILGERPDPRARPPLVAALADVDPNVRFHAIEALGKLGAVEAVDQLAAIAESGDFFLAFPALEALAAIGDPRVAPRLAPLLADEALRVAVADALGRLGDEDIVEPLVGLLHQSAAPAEVVAEALARLHHRYETSHGGGEHIAALVRRAIAPAGTQHLLDAVSRADDSRLRPLAMAIGWLEGPAVQRALTRLLGHRTIRGSIVEALVRHGERVVDLLIDQLGAEDLDTRQAAAIALGRIGDRRATGPLTHLLRGDPELLIVAAGALARIGDPAAFDPLLSLLGHEDAAVRLAAIAALNSIGHPRTAERVASLLRSPDPRLRHSGVRIAGYFGYAACAGALLACCADSDEAVRRAALEHLPFLEDARVVPALLEAIGDVNPKIRASAAGALARVEDARVLDPLVAALADADLWVRYHAARALGGRAGNAAAAALSRHAAADPAVPVRLAAIEALGRTGGSPAVAALAPIARAAETDLAVAALEALGRIGHPDAWPPLREALRGERPELRAAAARAAGRRGGAAAIAALEWLAAAEADPDVARAAVNGLLAAAGGAEATAAVRALCALSADPARRDAAVAALAALPPARIDDVAAGLRDGRPDVRCAVVQALGRMRQAAASRWVETALDDPSAAVRLAALTELRHVGARAIDRRVVTLLRGDPDPRVRRAAMAVLSRQPQRREGA